MENSSTPPIHPLWFICLILRFLFGILVMRGVHLNFISQQTVHNTLTIVLVVVGIGFAYQWINHSPSKRGAFGTNVWWAADRPVHATLFFVAAITHHMGIVRAAGALIIADTAFSVANRLI